MTTVVTGVVVLALLVLAGLALATAMATRMGPRLERASAIAFVVAEALLVVAALVDVVRVVVGPRPDELVVHLGYVVVSVLLLPLLVRPLGDDPSADDVRGRQLLLALVSVATLVVVLRQAATA